MIGTLWSSNRYQNTDRIFLVVRPQKGYISTDKGYMMLDLLSGDTFWGYEREGNMFIPATGSIMLEPFQ